MARLLRMLLAVSMTLGLNSCNTPPAPKGEVCVLGDTAGCYDGEQDKSYQKSLEEIKGYIARPGDYDQKLANWCMEGWRRYEECRK